MKKILEIIGSLKIGGQEKIGKEIGLHIDKKKYEIHYLVFDKEKGEYEKELNAEGIKIFHFPEPSEGYLRYLMNLKKLLKENNYSIIHAHTMFNCGWAMFMGWYMKVPCRISHSHSIKMADFHYGTIMKIYQGLMRQLIKRFGTEFIGCGKAAGQWLFGKNFFEKRGKILYNGIDTRQFLFSIDTRIKMREKLNLQNQFVIGHAGHFAQVKNQKFLIALMPEIIKEIPEARLILVGDGELKVTLQKECENLGIMDRVIMTGNVLNVADYLCAMDVFVFPSLYEGMPLSVIEVQCNGLPCVISDSVPDDVYLTDLIRPLSLKDPIEKWILEIGSAKRKNEESYGKQMRKSEFDISVMLQKLYRIYDKAVM
ncbi:glycosyltransferase [Lacrimispora saccharolytica]|nr:glycosyltransferase [Lacrimispora saccharolytica]